MSKFRGIPCRQRILMQSMGDASGCWLWHGSKDKDGYGYIKRNGKTTKAHRAAYAEFKGEIPEGLWVLHTCDNSSCVNPDHLWLGTAQDNLDDMHRKGRQNYTGTKTKLWGHANPKYKHGRTKYRGKV